MRCLPLLTLLLACAAAEDLPTAPAGSPELHGTLAGERFWIRLNPAKAEFGGDRMLELVYGPPAPAQVGGALLPDCPFLLLDQHLLVVAYNGRDSLTQVVMRKAGYHVTREEEHKTEDGKAAAATTREVDVAGPRGWDERLAPVLLALVWKRDGHGTVPSYDLFAAAPLRSAVSWNGEQVTIAGRACHATADSAGRLQRLDDAAGKPILTVTSWITPSP